MLCVLSSKWHVWFASDCPGRCLSTWQMIAASCPTAIGALCGQLTFRLAWCHEHSAVTATELFQPLDLACGTLFWSSCTIQTSPSRLFRWQLKGHLFWEAWTRRSVTSDMRHLRKTLTYLLKASYINITVKYFTRVKIVSCFCLHAELFKGFLIMLISMDVWRLTFI